MAILDELGPDAVLPTEARAETVANGVVHGPLWIVGSGDPEVDATTMRRLARELEDAGIDKVDGRVLGSTRPFARDWNAPGWKPYFRRLYVPRPTALTFDGNVAGGRHIRNPEKRAAAALTRALRERGVRVTGKPGIGEASGGLTTLASVDSADLEDILRHMNVPSSNFRAEVLGKVLGHSVQGAPGTIAKGAKSIEEFAAQSGVSLEANDGSGLSYENRVSPEGMVALLWRAEDSTWGDDLRHDALARPGQGTLSGRLGGIKVRAKTGTLTNISALSGWVKLDETGTWAAFSILSRGISKDRAVRIEDTIVRTVAARAP
jgi:D-alanyl-D-alanine carboxypeptidase